MKLPQIEAEHLLLTSFSAADFAGVKAWAGDAENIRYMLWGPFADEAIHAFLQVWAQNAALETPTGYQFNVKRKAGGGNIGCGFFELSEPAEIGWVIQKEYWGQGLGAELGRALLRFGFDTLGLPKIVAHCDAENTGSHKLMEKIGMRRTNLSLQTRQGNAALDGALRNELTYETERQAG
ncbi:MAG: GNAT family N-acetyltransferase [Oscillospiraceae bacterium]|jgi:RimJ/RimL family protein N-acetyltransferase|nr:GNAT family N-acetyltransferase [Oscillospiraceae bacterium]